MKIKSILSITFCLLISASVLTQNYSEKLLVKYSHEEIENLKKENFFEYELLNYFVEKGYKIIDMPDKEIDYVDLKKIDSETGEVVPGYIISETDLIDFNPLRFNCIYDETQRMYYKAGNTGKLIIVPTVADLNNKIDNLNRIKGINR